MLFIYFSNDNGMSLIFWCWILKICFIFSTAPACRKQQKIFNILHSPNLWDVEVNKLQNYWNFNSSASWWYLSLHFRTRCQNVLRQHAFAWPPNLATQVIWTMEWKYFCLFLRRHLWKFPFLLLVWFKLLASQWGKF